MTPCGKCSPCSLLFVISLLIAVITTACNKPADIPVDKPKPETPAVASGQYQYGYTPPSVITDSQHVAANRPASSSYTNTGFPSQAQYINPWIAAAYPGNPVVRAHGWNIWAALTTLTDVSIKQGGGNYLPNFMTWYSSYELYGVNSDAKNPCSATAKAVKDKHGILRCRDVSLLAFNKLSLPEAQYILKNNYNDYTTLASREKTPLDLPPHTSSKFNANSNTNVSFSVKPVYYLLKNNAWNLLPYWGGMQPGTTTTPGKPVPTTWQQCVSIKVGTPARKEPQVCNPGQGNANVPKPEQGWEIATLSQFLAVPLTQAMVEGLDYAQKPNTPIQASSIISLDDSLDAKPTAGDVAVLVGMHVTVRETQDWVWQTFYWSPGNTRVKMNTAVPVFPPKTDRYVAGPNYPASSFDNPFTGTGKNMPGAVPEWAQYYAMCTAYSPVYPQQPRTGGSNKDTFPQICYNPWLETSFDTMPGHFSDAGLNSNCMTCHQQASLLGGFTNKAITCSLSQGFGYYMNGYISQDNSCLTNQNYMFDFSWHITNAYKAPEEKATVNKSVIKQKPPRVAPGF